MFYAADKTMLEGMGEKNTQLRFSQNYHLAAIKKVDAAIESVHVPLTGHNIFFELVTGTKANVIINSFTAEVIGISELQKDSIFKTAQPAPGLDLSDDLKEARERSLANSRPIELPDMEIFLDATPCVVRAALEEDGSEVRPMPSFPLTVPQSTHLKIVFCPITENMSQLDWRLTVNMHGNAGERRESNKFRLTADSGFQSFLPNNEVRPTPVHKIVPHWQVRKPLESFA